MPESRGLNILKPDDTSILVFVQLFDGSNAKITSGTASLRLWELIPTSGALKTYDFNDNTFKTGVVTTPTAGLTHRTAENSTYNSGVWTYRHSTLTAFTAGNKYFAEVSHASLAHAVTQVFQYGGVEGDPNVIADHVLRRAFATASASADGDSKTGRSLLGAVAKLVNRFAVAAGVATVYEADDATGLFTQTVTTDSSAQPITAVDTA